MLFLSFTRFRTFFYFLLFISVFILLSTCCYSKKSNGQTGDFCENDQQCAPGYTCECSIGSSCGCSSNKGITNCKSDNDCPNGEICLASCVSETTTVAQSLNSETNASRDSDPKAENGTKETSSNKDDKSSSSDASKVCIGIHHLEEIESNQLIFSQHRQANVLCDNYGSCATPGHIVSWNGKAMMMLNYCENHAKNCIKRMMKVNSPRLSKGMRISSLTNGLQFTSLAARYATAAEEVFLTTLIHIGL